MNKKLMTRTEYDSWINTLPKGVCTFCEYPQYQIILKEFDNWVWVANLAPYWQYHTLIIPKRHFIEYEDQTFKEAAELLTILHFAKRKMIDSTPTDRIVHFWRYRDAKTAGKMAHFHLHLVPDKENSWGASLDRTAYQTDIERLIG